MHKLTKEYKDSFTKFDDFKIKVESLILELLIQNKISYHKIESRTKAIDKLDEKIYRKNEKYSSIQEVTDLVGIRVITYLEDEVDKIADIIKQEFEIDQKNSIDKRKLDSDRFGYKSLHYVISLSEERKRLTEYKRFQDIKFEIQIRSILQHAWAEIEHDIGYKSENAIPDIFKRNFYRVAALLETADIEFVNIKDGLSNYEQHIADKIKKQPETVEINAASLKSFILTNSNIKYTDKKISENTGCKLIPEKEFFVPESYVDKLNFLGINNISELNKVFVEEREKIIEFATKWVGTDGSGRFAKGVSLFYLCYLLVGKRGDLQFANEYYSKMISREDKIDPNGAEIIKVFKSLN